MKVVILAGGKGTRISEESRLKPKPMVEIGGMPIIWHIMKYYSCFGFHEFVICCGYKGQMLKEYFLHYYVNQSDSTFLLRDRDNIVHSSHAEPWKITLVNTGLHTLTAGRLLQVKDYIPEDTFLLTYGDGVSDVNIPELIRFHEKNGRVATITVTRPPGRFGTLQLDSDTDRVLGFKEKDRADSSWINIGFMVMNREVFRYLGDGSRMLEDTPFKKLVAEKQMSAYRHGGFWSPMDTMRDRDYLEELWNDEKAPWKVW